jgi:hypothetical protein
MSTRSTGVVVALCVARGRHRARPMPRGGYRGAPSASEPPLASRSNKTTSVSRERAFICSRSRCMFRCRIASNSKRGCPWRTCSLRVLPTVAPGSSGRVCALVSALRHPWALCGARAWVYDRIDRRGERCGTAVSGACRVGDLIRGPGFRTWPRSASVARRGVSEREPRRHTLRCGVRTHLDGLLDPRIESLICGFVAT